jgi:predicted dehydrogenase
VTATRVGIVGAGAVGARHARVLAGLPDAEVVAVADPERERAEALAAEHGARAHAGHEELLAAERLDAVYVCVPPFAHGAAERAVLAAGLALFVEKPLAADLATAEAIAADVERAGVVTGTGYHWRCLDTVDEARALLEGRPPRLVTATWVDKRPPPPWWARRALSGGQVVEQTTHVLDVVRALAGEVAEVAALADRRPRPEDAEADVDDATVATLRFASGALGTVVTTSLAATKHRAGVEVVADGLVAELTETELTVTDGDGRRTRSATVDPREAVDAEFVAAVRAGAPDRVRVPYAEALRTHRLACAIGAAAGGGRAVRLAA